MIKPQETKRRKELRTTKTTRKEVTKWQLSTYLSIITLNVNGLNVPIKRHRMADWIKKQDCCL